MKQRAIEINNEVGAIYATIYLLRDTFKGKRNEINYFMYPINHSI